jgi:peroxiredoxin Q/BCP
MLKIADTAPEFNVLCDDGSHVSLSSFKGKNVVLYFYPKDDTPGCTIESCDFQDSLSSIHEKDTIVLGISRDDMKSHVKFKQKYGLTFPLLVDTDETVCGLYDVMIEKNMYGKKVRGIERSTFLIDKDGKIAHIWRPVTVEGHVDAILEKLKN